MKKYIIALDQGTTSSRAIIFDKNQKVIAKAQSLFPQIYPKPGWVEHDPMDLWSSQSGVLNEVIAKANIKPEEIDSIGITNQRETTLVWNKETGEPIYNAVVWQCRRTQDICDRLIADGHEDYIRETTGLVADAYFSGPKIKWILDHVDGAKQLAKEDKLMFGTVDTWLLYKFTGGKVFATDVTNASRTMLYDIHNLCWDQKMCELLEIPMSMLPEVKNSSDQFGYVNIQGFQIPICSVVGDQQGALFGQACFDEGDVKNTYGTGGFLLMNTKDKLVHSHHGLITTIGIGIDDQVEYALEGSIFNAGSVVQWLRDELQIISSAEETEMLAQSLKNNEGVYLVPAFTGLGAPYWDMDARGTLIGLTRGTNRKHIVRAGLESIAYQSYDVLTSMEQDSNLEIKSIKVDGGASNNNFLMQFQADIMNTTVIRNEVLESSALGACYLAGLYTGFFKSKDEIRKAYEAGVQFVPHLEAQARTQYLDEWHDAVSRTLLKPGKTKMKGNGGSL